MKYTRIALCLILVLTMLAVVPKPAQAALGDTQTLSFVGCTSNNTGDVAIAESQMRVIVEDVGSKQIKFRFLNLGPLASSITDVYFDDGTLLGIASIANGPGVDFSQGASPGDLPGGNGCEPQFEATAGFTADSNSPTQPMGVNPVPVGDPVEWVDIVFNLKTGLIWDDVRPQLESGELRIGIHVQGFASGGSESLVNQPPTAVKLASFNARIKSGLVSIDWMTGTEISNAGFNIYRSTSPTGSRVKINNKLLGAHGDAASGASYSITDRPGYGAFYYWLEDVDLGGKATLHGPVSVNTLRSPIYRPFAPVMP